MGLKRFKHRIRQLFFQKCLICDVWKNSEPAYARDKLPIWYQQKRHQSKMHDVICLTVFWMHLCIELQKIAEILPGLHINVKELPEGNYRINTRFFISDISKCNAKKMLSSARRLKFSFLKIIHILHSRYHPKIIGHILKKAKKQACLYSWDYAIWCFNQNIIMLYLIEILIIKMEHQNNMWNLLRACSSMFRVNCKVQVCLSLILKRFDTVFWCFNCWL